MESVRIDFDASVSSDGLFIGFLIKDPDTSEVIDSQQKNMFSRQGSTQGEVMSVLHAIRYTVNKYNPDHIDIYGDSHSVIHLLKPNTHHTSNKSDMKQLIDCIYSLLRDTVESFNTYHIYSHENDAHHIATKMKQ